MDLSSRFASVPAGQVQAEIEDGLKAVAECLRAEACGLMEPPENAEAPWITSFQAAPGGPRGARADEWSPAAGSAGDFGVRPRSVDELLTQVQPDRAPRPGADRRTSVAVPIRLGDRVLGALSFDLDSPPTLWSPARSEQLRGIASVFAHALQRKRAEEQIEDSLGFEELVVQLSSLVSRAPLSHLESALAEGLRRVAEALRIGPLAFLEFASGAGEPRTICRYGEAVGLSSMPLRSEQIPELGDRLLRGEVIRLAQIANAGVLALQDSAPRDSASVLLLPLAISGAPLCALSVAVTPGQRGPPERLVPRLRLIGEIFASGWARTKTGETTQPATPAVESLERSSRAEHIYVHERLAPDCPFEGVIGGSDALRYVLFKVDQVARTDATTLLLGETGTGKSLIARAIHERGARGTQSLITVNCATLPAGLVEAELFGREKGGYTGAHRSQPGRFELAHGSTILLDEVGDLPLELQPKLLRILQDGELERVGNPRTLNVDVRVIAATNRNLEEEVRRGRFREDLYYRLNVFPITLPALRERRDDIPDLVRHLLERLGRKLGKPIERVPDAVMAALQAHTWPGNVRELESVLTRALIVATDTTLRLADRLAPASDALHAPSAQLAEIERAHIYQMLARHEWHIEGATGAASALGMNPSTLRGRMRKLEIHRPK